MPCFIILLQVETCIKTIKTIKMTVHLWTLMASNQQKAVHSDHKILTLGRTIWSWKWKVHALRTFWDEKHQHIKLWDNPVLLDSGWKRWGYVSLVSVPIGLPGAGNGPILSTPLVPLRSMFLLPITSSTFNRMTKSYSFFKYHIF